MLQKKRLLLAVSGGVAAYRAANLARQLMKSGAAVRVIMTRNATRLVRPLLFATLTGNPVYARTFRRGDEGEEMPHISLRHWADALVVCPATANVIGKFAHGIADDLVSTTYLSSSQSPVIIAPAMNPAMWAHPAVQENIETLKDTGHFIVGPGRGVVACGEEGWGRLAPLAAIVDSVRAALHCRELDLTGQRFVITAGPTVEPVDAVRVLTNPSSGKMGYALARAAAARGAAVVLIAGPNSLAPPFGVELIPVGTAREMAAAVTHALRPESIFIGAAAVADFRPAQQRKGKRPKAAGGTNLALTVNPDIIAGVTASGAARLAIGFSATATDTLAASRKKLTAKKLNAIVANNITKSGAGFGSDCNEVTWITRKTTSSSGKQTKLALAHWLLDKLSTLSKSKQ